MIAQKEIERSQRAICERLSVDFFRSPPSAKLGIALNARGGLLPLNGLRHLPDHGTTGWYIWAGEELSVAPDFFVPLHVKHLVDWCPQAQPYLGLPPGWRFLLGDGYEDLWFDPSLLDA